MGTIIIGLYKHLQINPIPKSIVNTSFQNQFSLTLLVQQAQYEYSDHGCRMSELIHLRQFRPWLYPDIVYNYTSAGRECKQRIKLLHTFTENVSTDHG